MQYYELDNPEYGPWIDAQDDAEKELTNSMPDDERANFQEVKENILSTLADSNSVDELTSNFITCRQRLNYAGNIAGRITIKSEDYVFNKAKLLYNILYNKFNGISE